MPLRIFALSHEPRTGTVVRMRRHLFLPLAFLAALLLSGCGADVVFTLDNPTDRPLAVTIDGEMHNLAPRTGEKLALAPGRHRLSAPDTGTVLFMVYTKGAGGIINPTLRPYVVIQEIYATDDAAAEHFKPFRKTIALDGVEFEGPFSVSSELFIEKAWQFDVHQPMPDSISVDAGRKGNIQGKVYTAEDFVAHFERNTDSVGRYERERRPAAAAPFAPKPPVVPDALGSDKWDTAFEPLRLLARRYLAAETADEQLAIRQENFDATMTFIEATAGLASKQSPEVNLRRQDLHKAVMEIFGHSALYLGKE